MTVRRTEAAEPSICPAQHDHIRQSVGNLFEASSYTTTVGATNAVSDWERAVHSKPPHAAFGPEMLALPAASSPELTQFAQLRAPLECL